MYLTRERLQEALGRVDAEGWDGAGGRALLEEVRRSVVVPVVGRSGLRGPAADQAAADGWAAAWDALRRPSARTAENPGGMVWVAVRRAVASARREPMPGPSVEQLMDLGWEPTVPSPAADPPGLGAVLGVIVDRLVANGWDRGVASDAVAMLADTAAVTPTPTPTSTPAPPSTSTPTMAPPMTTDTAGSVIGRWRLVAMRLGIPQWQARRLAGLLLGGVDVPGVLELVVLHGGEVLDDEAVQAAVRSTTVRWSAGPATWLVGWAS